MHLSSTSGRQHIGIVGGSGTEGRWARVSRALLVLVLLGAAAGLLRAPASAQTPTTATVTPSDGLNLRASASSGSALVLAIPAGATVTITGDPTADGWYPVDYAGSSGWVDGAYLALGQTGAAAAPASPAAAAGSASTSMTVSVDALNLRASPDTTGAVLATLPMGTMVQVTGAAVDTWLPVTVNGVSGWMDSNYLTPNQVSAAAPATAPASSSAPAAVSELATVLPSPAAGAAPVPVSLTVTTAAGQPLSGHTFTLSDQQGVATQTQITDQSGHATFTSIAPGIYSIAEAPSTGVSFISMTINGAGATPGQLFELQTGGRYDIKVVDAQTTTGVAAPPAATTAPGAIGTPAASATPAATANPRPPATNTPILPISAPH